MGISNFPPPKKKKIIKLKEVYAPLSSAVIELVNEVRKNQK